MAWFPANLGRLRGGARFQDLCQEGVPERLASQSDFVFCRHGPLSGSTGLRVCGQGPLC